jgi:uncharacterized protein YegJ (DUF2314 family)
VTGIWAVFKRQFRRASSIAMHGLAVLAIGTTVAPPNPVLAQGIIDVPNSDQAMAAAIEKARATLPAFWTALKEKRPGDERFAVKIRYPTTRSKSDGEHIWANEVEQTGDTVNATINNEPRAIANLKIGQRVTVPVDQLTDWMFFRDGKMHGAQTVRVLLPMMQKPDADRLRAILAPE